MGLLDKILAKKKEEIMLVDNIYEYWLNRLYNDATSIYYLDNAPENIDSDLCEILLVNDGHFGAFKNNNTYYTIGGSFSGVSPYSQYNPVYSPEYIAVLVGLDEEVQEKTHYKIGEEIAIIRANKMTVPMVPLIEQYALTLADCTNSIDMCVYNTRAFNLFSASTEVDVKSIQGTQNDLRRGIGSKVLKRSIRSGGMENIPQNANVTPINDLVVAQNNILRQFYRDLGCSMGKDKTQAILSDEKEMDDQALMFALKTGKQMRQKGWDEFNRIFGENVIVKCIFDDEIEAYEEALEEPEEEEASEEEVIEKEGEEEDESEDNL